MKKYFLLLVILTITFPAFGFFPSIKKDWQEGVATVGIKANVTAEEPEVFYERGKFLGLNRFSSLALQKDEILQDRIHLALKDFSFQKVIFKEFEAAFKRFTPWKVVKEEAFATEKPEVIFYVEVVKYGMRNTGIKYDTRVFFIWEVTAYKEDKPIWHIKRKKQSVGRNLKQWMFQDAEMLKGELETHILFAVQDLMYKTKIRQGR